MFSQNLGYKKTTINNGFEEGTNK